VYFKTRRTEEAIVTKQSQVAIVGCNEGNAREVSTGVWAANSSWSARRSCSACSRAKESSRLEASGVALLDDTTAVVVFDNRNWVASIDLSLKARDGNRLFPAPSLGSGFEDIAIDRKHGGFFCPAGWCQVHADGGLKGKWDRHDNARPAYVNSPCLAHHTRRTRSSWCRTQPPRETLISVFMSSDSTSGARCPCCR
jgi:hypothetical protein